VRSPAIYVALVLASSASGCRGDARVFDDHRQGIVSAQATAATTAESWLAGSVSQTYARLTLERTQQLLAERHADLSANPELLASGEGASLSQREERLSRMVASLAAAIGHGDAAAARQHLDTLRGDGLAP
jgi:hypothetical protein